MAGLFDYQDPESVGRMMFAAGLLNAAGPSKMPVSTGQALAQGLLARQQGATEAAQSARRNLLLEAQARRLDSETAQGGKLPAALQVAQAYMSMSPEQRAIFDHTNKAQIVDVGGIKYLRTPEGVVPLVSKMEGAGNAAAIAGAREGAIQDQRARYDVMPGFDSVTNRDVFTTRHNILGGIQQAPQRPALSAFNAPPSNPISNAPRVGQPMSRPNTDAEGLNPDGYRSVEDLRAAMQGQVATMPQVVPSGIQPPAAGNAVRGQATKEAENVGASFGKMFEAIQSSGFDAQANLAKLDRFESLLSGIETGKLTPIGTEIAGYMKSLGIDIDPNLPNKQAADSLAKEMALMLRKPGQQSGGMPGNFSDADRNFLVAIAPGLANTPGGNQLIIQTARKTFQREAEMAKMAQEYRDRTGSMNGFVQFAKQYAEANPLFAEESAKARSLTTQTPTSTSPAFKVGTRSKTKDGRDVEFDGKGWKLVKP